MDEYSVENALMIHRDKHLVSGFIVCVLVTFYDCRSKQAQDKIQENHGE